MRKKYYGYKLRVVTEEESKYVKLNGSINQTSYATMVKYYHMTKDKYQNEDCTIELVGVHEDGTIGSVIFSKTFCKEVVEEDKEKKKKKIVDKQGFYDYLFSLEYIGVSFKLKMGNRDLSELSPGERGIVLLIFYLALSKNKMPIIIDQPEDNLDNQSVYSKLVPCICKAKQKRQVIIVTHNPNIAVACDAEQIIYCNMDKNSFSISYEAGAIEDPIIKNRVIDVLEGTMPAFDLRRKKYEN